ncbi:hypothetical protein MYX07_00570 [Patescibacteria group bacterium AH-259-L07]|nr:hypothetical protein [Patescibacteria group bacterium AH-259-L07]
MPYDTSDGLKKLKWENQPYADNYFMQSAHIFESRNDDSIDLFLGRKTKKNKKFIKNFQKTLGGYPKPVISGSDAHKYSEYGKFPNGKITWIKADTTFQGFKQIVNEPEDRVYIGTLPLKISEIEKNRSKYVDSIKISNVNHGASPSWFNDELPLNSGLVAVIGRKGSGKSAFTDIVSLLGRSKINPDDYSFLTTKKFRKKGLAKNYQATLRWLDKKETKANLDSEVVQTEVEEVAYLPQKYVETICNEDGVSVKFQQEIDKVIYSYVPDENRLGTNNLADLVKIKTEVIDGNITKIRNTIHDINVKVVNLESKNNDTYVKQLKKKLADKQRQLKSLSKPKIVKKPTLRLSEKQQKRYDSLTMMLGKVDKEISTSKENLKDIEDKLVKIQKIESSIDELLEKFEAVISKFTDDARLLSLDLNKIIKIKLNKSSIIKKKTALTRQKNNLLEKLNIYSPDEKVGLSAKKSSLQDKRDKITKTLDADQKLYEEYKKRKEDYENQKKKIIGKKDDGSLETIKSIEAEIKYVQKFLVTDLKELKKKRSDKARTLFQELEKKISFYKEIYYPLTQFIAREKEAQKRVKSILSFDVGIVFDRQGFSEQFLGHINQNRDGSFQFIDKGKKILNDIIVKYDFIQEKETEDFTQELIEHLEEDKTNNPPTSNVIKDQLKGGDEKNIEFYDFVFGFGYLDVKYKLLFNGKDLNDNEFSPGEKGTLLLIFYLLIDKGDIPLIMDQPEENLDNESVYELLVPYIKRAKQKRQLIIVTHNPNLAVVCDAEQIISASMNKRVNEIRYSSGSIENPATNKRVVDVLEGTMPAFTIRDTKYIKNDFRESFKGIQGNL